MSTAPRWALLWDKTTQFVVGISGGAGLLYGAWAYSQYCPTALNRQVHADARENFGQTDHEAMLAKAKDALSDNEEAKKKMIRRHTEGDLTVFKK